MKYSLVIPCYNEAKNLPKLLEKCLPLKDKNIEVILVNNGSTDNSEDILNALLPKYPHCRTVQVSINQGYGYGILFGLQQAKGDILGWTHADIQTDPKDFLAGIAYFKNASEYLFVKGKRFGRPYADILFTIGMSFFESCLFKEPFWDINAQPTIFTKDFFREWQQPPYDFSLDLFAYVQAKKSNLQIKRFPVLFSQRHHGVSNWNVNLSSKFKFIKRTLKYSLELRKRIP